MGPDEYPTREELGLMLKVLEAQIAKLIRTQTELVAMLHAKELLTEPEIALMATQIVDSAESTRLRERVEKMRQFAEVHKTARQYLDPPEE
jgi:uncharacterized protein YydD (DUF2326 family)